MKLFALCLAALLASSLQLAWKAPADTDDDWGVPAMTFNSSSASVYGHALHAEGVQLTLYVELPSDTPVLVWELGPNGVPASVVAAGMTAHRVVTLPLGDAYPQGNSATLAVEAIMPDGTAVPLGKATLKIGPPQTMQATAPQGAGTAGATGSTENGGYAFQCHKAVGCRLKIVLASGEVIMDKLEDNETAFISGSHAVYAVCGCD